MKNFILIFALAFSLSSLAQCTNLACENLPASISVDVSPPPAGQSYTINWNIPVAFTAVTSDSIVITNVGAAPNVIPFDLTVTNNVTGCVTYYACTIQVNTSAPVTLTIPPSCSTDAPFDISSYINPPNSIVTGPGISNNFYNPAIGGPVNASPPANSGCLIASTQTPQVNTGPTILSVTTTQ